MASNYPVDAWSVLTRCNWDNQTELVVALDGVFGDLDGVAEEAVVYDYIDPDAVTAVFDSTSESRGANELQFDCEGHVIRIESDGTIAARPRSA